MSRRRNTTEAKPKNKKSGNKNLKMRYRLVCYYKFNPVTESDQLLIPIASDLQKIFY